MSQPPFSMGRRAFLGASGPLAELEIAVRIGRKRKPGTGRPCHEASSSPWLLTVQSLHRCISCTACQQSARCKAHREESKIIPLGGRLQVSGACSARRPSTLMLRSCPSSRRVSRLQRVKTDARNAKSIILPAVIASRRPSPRRQLRSPAEQARVLAPAESSAGAARARSTLG